MSAHPDDAPRPAAARRSASPGHLPGTVLTSAQLTDAPALAALAKGALSGEGWSESGWRAEIASPAGRVLLARARHGNALVAGIAARAVAGELQILQVATAASWRRRGVARHLVQTLLARARAEGLAVAHLELRASNEPARDLYASCGFVEVARSPRYYRGGEDALRMSLRLAFEAEPGATEGEPSP